MGKKIVREAVRDVRKSLPPKINRKIDRHLKTVKNLSNALREQMKVRAEKGKKALAKKIIERHREMNRRGRRR